MGDGTTMNPMALMATPGSAATSPHAQTVSPAAMTPTQSTGGASALPLGLHGASGGEFSLGDGDIAVGSAEDADFSAMLANMGHSADGAADAGGGADDWGAFLNFPASDIPVGGPDGAFDFANY